jgi:NAD(P)-dependent dehydrogenase (short-subunit alcohol dehydrogenase family)
MERPVVLITGALTGIGRATAQAFAREGARIVVSGMRVKGVAPGPIETPMLDRLTERKTEIAQRVALRRTGTPEEAAEAVVFMASDKASFITGATLSVDGGRVAV